MNILIFFILLNLVLIFSYFKICHIAKSIIKFYYLFYLYSINSTFCHFFCSNFIRFIILSFYYMVLIQMCMEIVKYISCKQ